MMKTALWILIVGLATFAATGTMAAEQAPRRLDRNNLLQYRKADGTLGEVRSVRHWQRRRDEILKSMQEVMGPFPGREKRCPLDVRIEEEVDCGSYIRRLITYASEPGGRVTAYLLIPKTALVTRKKHPAVLALHSTDARLGHKVVVGLGPKPNRHYGQELAERGYVVLAPSYPLLADYNPDLKALGYRSGTMKAIWDNVRGLDLLDSFPFVKRGRYGAIGHSLGGHNAIYTAAFDDRVQVIVSSCGFDSYLDYMNGNIKGWTSERYMPRLLEYRLEEIPFDFHEIIGALAPRRLFVNAPIGDSNFQWQSVDRVLSAASQVYRLYRRPERIQVEHPDCGHDFPDEIRAIAYRILDDALK